jgi:uncharacterized protein (UPF0147 family)
MKKILILVSVFYASTNNAMQGLRSMIAQHSVIPRSIRQATRQQKSKMAESNNLGAVQRRIAELEIAEIQKITDPIEREYAMLKRQEDILLEKNNEVSLGRAVAGALGINAGLWGGLLLIGGILSVTGANP